MPLELVPMPVGSPTVIPATGFTGQITVTTAGTLVDGPDVSSLTGFRIKAHPSNTGVAWVIFGTTKNDGYPLAVGQDVFVPVVNLKMLKFDCDTSGNKLCYIKA